MELIRFESSLWETASVLLVDGEALVFDPCISVEEVAAIRARAAAMHATVGHVVVTHGDWDHVCGIAAFPDAVAAMGPLTAERVAADDAAARVEREARAHGLAVAGPRRADRVLEPGSAHRLGPFVVETMAVPGHTPDGTAYRLRQPDVLVIGDHLSAAEFPFASSTAAYRATLAGLVDLLGHDPPELVIPGHGPPLSASEALAIAEEDLDYLRRLRDAVAGSLAEGGTSDEARAAGLAVALPRDAPADLRAEREANVEATARRIGSEYPSMRESSLGSRRDKRRREGDPRRLHPRALAAPRLVGRVGGSLPGSRLRADHPGVAGRVRHRPGDADCA